MPNYDMVPTIAVGDLIEWFGDEWRNDLTVHQNIKTLTDEVRHFRTLMSTLEHFVVDLDDWLVDYDGGDFNSTTEEVVQRSSEYSAELRVSKESQQQVDSVH